METESKITPKPNLTLRRIGNKYMIVEASESCVNLTNVYSMNETAARLWEAINKGDNRTPAELAEDLCVAYRVDYDRALRDIELQMEEWKKMGLLD